MKVSLNLLKIEKGMILVCDWSTKVKNGMKYKTNFINSLKNNDHYKFLKLRKLWYQVELAQDYFH